MKIAGFLRRYKAIFLYGIFGSITTFLNILAFWLFIYILSLPLIVANIFAWILAFIFAFTTNKLFVFESKSWDKKSAIKEFLGFLTARLLTLLLDSFLLYCMVVILNVSAIISKIVIDIIVIIANYVASKFFIFRNAHV